MNINNLLWKRWIKSGWSSIDLCYTYLQCFPLLWKHAKARKKRIPITLFKNNFETSSNTKRKRSFTWSILWHNRLRLKLQCTSVGVGLLSSKVTGTPKELLIGGEKNKKQTGSLTVSMGYFSFSRACSCSVFK